MSNAEPEDILIERAGAKVLVDSLSLTYLAGSEIDYVGRWGHMSPIDVEPQQIAILSARTAKSDGAAGRCQGHVAPRRIRGPE